MAERDSRNYKKSIISVERYVIFVSKFSSHSSRYKKIWKSQTPNKYFLNFVLKYQSARCLGNCLSKFFWRSESKSSEYGK